MRILLCAGTRPNFVKIAPIYHSAKKKGVSVDILHTGQHYDYLLNNVFFEQLQIPDPAINLEVTGSSREEVIEKIALGVSSFLNKNKYDFVITVGDVNSTLGCSIGAKRAGTSVAHVESGLRSNDKRMPEDANRVETDKICDYLFISEPDGIINLKLEGKYNTKTCFYVGNVMIDSLYNNLKEIEQIKLPKNLVFGAKSYCLVTLHRPSNVNEKLRLKRILKFLNWLSGQIKVVFPMHPRTKVSIEKFGYYELLKPLILSEPLGYFEFLHLEKYAKFIITDSGGAQEETSIFNVPCITMRANTERPVTIFNGTSFLAGEDLRLAKYYTELALANKLTKKSNIKLWDGKTSERIIAMLLKLFREERQKY